MRKSIARLLGEKVEWCIEDPDSFTIFYERVLEEDGESINEISRRAGNVIRGSYNYVLGPVSTLAHGIAQGSSPHDTVDKVSQALTGSAMKGGLVAAIKHHVRTKYDLHHHIADYHAAKRDIRASTRMTRQQKTDALDGLEKHTLKTLAAQVHKVRQQNVQSTSPGKSIRSGKRAIYGTTFGTRVF